MFSLGRPSPAAIGRFLDESRELPLTYSPVGLAASGGAAGFTLDEQATVIGSGREAFDRAVLGLSAWAHFDMGWVEIFPKRAPIEKGTVVAVLIRHYGFWSLNGCRVVYAVGAPGDPEFGFAYGTLNNHGECGEELFKVSLAPGTGEVTYVIRAASRPRSPLACLGYPAVRLLQRRFRHDSTRALAGAVGGKSPC